jgi:hypothetical protein
MANKPEAKDPGEAKHPGKQNDGLIRCDACPVLCRIREGRTGACDRYGNVDGKLVRTDPMVVAQKVMDANGEMIPFAALSADWDGSLISQAPTFLTGIGATTTYPDYKPAPFIVSTQQDGVDMVTIVSEGVFSYCGVKIKIDTDAYIGPEPAAVRVKGEQVGHVTTAEYGSQMLAIGGVRHLTGGSKKEGAVTCDTMLRLCNKEAVELSVDGGATIVVQAGKAPIVNDIQEERMRVGCGSATVLSEHQAGQFLDMPACGIRVRGRRSTPGRYFQVADHGAGWGGTNVEDPLEIIDKIDEKRAWPGLRLLMVDTTGQDSSYYVLDDDLNPVPADMPDEVRLVVDRIGENCEPALCSVMFMAGAGGSLRAGVTLNPVRLTRSVRESLTRVTCGGAPVFVWPGGGITLLVDVNEMPDNSFGYVPTPALVAPIEFTVNRDDFAAFGGYVDRIQPLEDVLSSAENVRSVPWRETHPWPLDNTGAAVKAEG